MQKSFRGVHLAIGRGTLTNIVEDAIDLAKVLEPHGIVYVTFKVEDQRFVVDSQSEVGDITGYVSGEEE